MKKKIIALMMVIPLILMFTIFSISNAVKITIDIPVGGVSITNESKDGLIYIDLADPKSDEFYLKVDVQPAYAANKEFTVSADSVEDSILADIDYDTTSGKITFNSCGKTKLKVTTKDGGYTDTVTFVVSSSKVTDFLPTIDNKTLEKGTLTDYAADITSGSLTFGAILSPDNLSDSDIEWTSSDNTILNINPVTGIATARMSGDVIVRATVTNGINGEITKTIALHINAAKSNSGLIVDGNGSNSVGEDETTLLASPNDESLSFYVEYNPNSDIIALADSSAESLKLSYDSNYISEYTVTPVEGRDNVYLVELNFIAQKPVGTTIEVKIFLDGAQNNAYTLNVTFANHEFRIRTNYADDNGTDIYVRRGSSVKLSVIATPDSPDLKYEWTINSNSISLTPSADGAVCTILSDNVAEAELTLTVSGKNGLIETISRKLHVVDVYSSINFGEKPEGMSDAFVVANKNVDVANSYLSSVDYLLKLQAADSSGVTDSIADDIIVTSSDSSLAAVLNIDGKRYLRIYGTGDVTISAVWNISEKLGIPAVSASVRIRVVDGVNVDSYESLKFATSNSKPVKIVIQKDIDVGVELFEYTYGENGKINGRKLKEGYSEADAARILKSEVHEIESTWDVADYTNNNKPVPKLYYAIEFKDDVYGNGHTLDADNITMMLQESIKANYNFAIFNGPLNFVALDYNTDSAAVKGQDNMAFLVRRNGITIDNITLKGCSDENLNINDANGNYVLDLTRLNYVGTTLEIMGDCTIKNSRIMNGRNVVRAFGKTKFIKDKTATTVPKADKLNVSIESSILSKAREFILKIGTNRAILGYLNENNGNSLVLPTFTDSVGKAFTAPSQYLENGNKTKPGNVTARNDSLLKDDYFNENYVLTDVSVTNCVFENSGLFSIGIETHFSGDMLAGTDDRAPWRDMACTSYPAILRIKGDVRIYDWKNLDNIDSSSLIEVNDNATLFSFLKLDINAMMSKIRAIGTDAEKKIINTIDGKNYAHGGITFYGGGKNYSLIDMSEYKGTALKTFFINIKELAINEKAGSILYNQGTLLPKAAGEDSFRFYLFDSESPFNLAKQIADKANGAAYNWMPIAK